jgi:para-nitrobenzyl esterase
MCRSLLLGSILLMLVGCGGGGGGVDVVDSPAAPVVEPPVLSADTVTSVRGTYRGTAHADGVAFKGIAYARPPIGALRWLPPEPAPVQEGTHDAFEFGAACAQFDGDGNVSSVTEDCLYLNVWTPDTAFPVDRRRPVLFFIHGGGNQRGSPDTEQLGVTVYDGAALAALGDVVVVTVGYRLGALGFLSHPALAAENAQGRAGNYGLLDQIEALRWVQDAIAAFGGDPERVTLFGESGGARDVCSLVASPLAAGLFHGAIMQSGGCRQRTQEAAEDEGRHIARNLGCDSEVDSQCLRAASPLQLLEALGPEMPGGAFVGQNIGPVVDSWVLNGSPDAVIGAGAHNPVPLVIGANAQETGHWVLGIGTGLDEAAYQALLRSQFGALLAERVLTQYPVSEYPDPAAAYTAVSTDSQFICPARHLAQAASAHSPPVFVYRFAQSLRSTPLSRAGAFHGLELFYLFQRVSELPAYTASDEDRAVEDQLARYWSAFAAAADPASSGAELPHWSTYSAETDRVLIIDADTRMVSEPRARQCDFWLELGNSQGG